MATRLIYLEDTEEGGETISQRRQAQGLGRTSR